MRKLNVQMSLFDTYNNVCETQENDKPEFLKLLETHVKIDEYIPAEFKWAYYRFGKSGRPREYELESILLFCILQDILGIPTDKTMLSILKFSRELRDYCGFDKIPAASEITRFKQNFGTHIKKMFDNLVEITEPVCRKIDPKKADYLIYDPTGIEAHVAENNPKFINGKINNAKKLAKNNPQLNAHSLAYSSMPETSKTTPLAKQQYINGHFCYAFKTGILTNGIGIIRDIAFFDEHFKKRHPNVVCAKTDNPQLDKEISDSASLKPVLYDFFAAHPTFSYKTFLGDSSFDSYDAYSMLRNDFGFERMCIPLNPRNSSSAHSDFDKNGTPLCPNDKSPFRYDGVCRGKNRSVRFKYLCPNSLKPKGYSDPVCLCQNPCTQNSYKCVYTYPHKNLRIYPGIPRGTEHWDNLYRHRTIAERTIFLLKEPLGGAYRKSYDLRTAKTNFLFAAITQLIVVILADAIAKPSLCKSVRKLIA